MKQLARYGLILVVVVALWNTVLVKPFKLFAVYLHELGHSFMAFIFGYGIQGFRVNLNESGYALVQTKGWLSSFLVGNGGYLGGVLLGLLILYLRRTALKKYILGFLAILLLVISIFFSGPTFTLLYSAIFAAVVIGLYMLQNEKVTDWAVDILGISSVAYAIYDTFVDVILLQINVQFRFIRGWYTQPMTDAVYLARLTHIPALIWGILWMGISLFAVYMVLIKASVSSPKKAKKG